MPVLVGEKVKLSPFVEEDIGETYLSWLNDPRILRFSNQRFLRHDHASSLNYLQSFSGTDNLFVALRRREDDMMIGTMTAYLSRAHGTVDVGLLVGEAAVWGGGYGFDAWRTFCDWLFATRGIRKLTAGTAVVNKGMIRIMERYGMHLEATRVAQEIIEDEAVDILYYAKFRDA
ncbi:GNAT family N-acetyltransferase [Herbaspirillum sp. NPDC101397]|uniref:GNAT family N-acetyltransferase n=1 Tax=Herbaspirillum sp. NPDC101397 TaxID=3364006 RepID=UPI00383B13D3